MMPCYTDCSFLHWDLSLTLTNDTKGPVCQLCSDPEMTLLGFLSFSHILRVYLQPRLISAFLFVAEFAYFFFFLICIWSSLPWLELQIWTFDKHKHLFQIV